MSFGNPLFLWSLLLISIPILIHLFRFRKYKKIIFTQTFFFEKTHVQQKRIKNLKQILILSARILTLITLVGAFSLPLLNHRNNQSLQEFENKNIVLYIDNHLGFFFTDEKGENRLTMLKTDALKLIDNLGSFKRISVLTNTSESEYFYRREDVVRYIYHIEPQLVVPNWNEIYLRITKHIKNESETPSIIVLSDFIKRGDNIQELKLSFTPFLTKPFDLKNTSVIDSLWREIGDEEYQASLFNYTSKNTFILGHQRRVLFTLRSQDYEKGKLKFVLPATIEESHLFLEPENNNNPIQRFFFSAEKGALQKILVLAEPENVSESLKEKFVKMQTADVDYIHVKNIKPEDIQNYSLVILLNIKEITDKIGIQLHSVIQKNGRVLIIPPKNADLLSYNRFLQRYDSKFLQPEIGLINTDKIEYRDMLFDGAFKNELEFPDLPYFGQIFPLEGRNLKKVLYTLSDRIILANINTNSSGQLYVFATPVDPESSNLIFHTIFNALMYNFINKKLTNINLYYYAGIEYVFTISPDRMVQDEPVKILTPSGEERIPYQVRTGKDIRVYFGRDIDQTGLYTFSYFGKKMRQAAFNADIRQVLHSTYTTNELSKILSIERQSILSETDLNKYPMQMGINKGELWYSLILAALIFYIIELLIIRFI